MLDREFDAFAEAPGAPLLPEELRAEIDELNAFVYDERQQRRLPHRLRAHAGAPTSARSAGSSTRSTSWTRASRRSRYLVGGRITEADWRLFPTLAALRRRVRRPLQVQPAPHRRLPAACRATCATATSTRASPRPSTWITSSGTTTARTPRSTRAASCPSARRSTSPRRTAASTSAARGVSSGRRARCDGRDLDREVGHDQLREHRHARRIRIGERLLEDLVEARRSRRGR